MEEILLISEAFVKSVTNVSDNLAGKYILPSIREAQDTVLKGVWGESLLERVKGLISTGDIEHDDFVMYKTLIGMSKYFLAYATIVEVTNKVSFKIGNFGVAQSNDENLRVASYEDIVKQQSYYQAKVDAYCQDLQNWLLANRRFFPELSECQCNKIQSNLYSHASCGVFLGGARGKGARGKRRCPR